MLRRIVSNFYRRLPVVRELHAVVRQHQKITASLYRAYKMPNIRKTTAIWRDECRRLGIGEVFLYRVDTSADTLPPNELGSIRQWNFSLTGGVWGRDWGAIGLGNSGGTWDNSARRRHGGPVFIESSPALFQQLAVNTLAKLKTSANTPSILFINAWNEWAEGNHLEPDQRLLGSNP